MIEWIDMERVKQIIAQELSHYHKLSFDGKKLIQAVLLYNVADPLLWLFINTFIYRSSQDMKILALYNGAVFAGLPLGFYINGKLLNRFLSSFLYAVGAIGTGVIAFFLVLLSASSAIAVSLFGFLFGFVGGIYWANRNFLTLRSTMSEHRVYFSSIEASTGTLINIVVPFIVGWFLVLGEQRHWYSIRTAYLAMTFIGFILMAGVGLIIKGVHPAKQQIKRVSLVNKSRRWNAVRIFTLISGIYGGIELFLPILMVLTIIGYENVLGTVQSAATIISALVVYTIGKHSRSGKDGFRLVNLSIFFALLAATSFSLLYSAIGVLLFFALDAFTGTLRWVGSTPIVNDAIDEEEKRTKIHHYSYVFDQELFLNIGRIIAVFAFITAYSLSPLLTFRYAVVIFALTQIGLYVSARKIRSGLS